MDLTLISLLCFANGTKNQECIKNMLERYISPYRICYYTTWARYRPPPANMEPLDVDPFLCSHIIMAFAWISDDGLLILQNEWEDKPIVDGLLQLKMRNPNLKILAAVGGWNFGSGPFRQITGSPENITAFANSAVVFLRQYKFDGLDLDWEYPSVEDRDQFTSLIKTLHEAFEDDWVQNEQRSKLLLAAAVPAAERNAGGYDVPIVKDYFDFISVMAYDFYGPWDNRTGHNAPLYSEETDDFFTVSAGSMMWVNMGMPRYKIAVGLPTYGHSFKLETPEDHGLNATTVEGVAGPFTRTPGFYSYYEVCSLLHQHGTKLFWDKQALVPYASNLDIWVSYDNLESLKHKVQWIRKHQFGGAMIWSLGLDDFSGNLCYSSQTPYPLTRAAFMALLENVTSSLAHAVIFNPVISRSSMTSNDTLTTSRQQLTTRNPETLTTTTATATATSSQTTLLTTIDEGGLSTEMMSTASSGEAERNSTLDTSTTMMVKEVASTVATSMDVTSLREPSELYSLSETAIVMTASNAEPGATSNPNYGTSATPLVEDSVDLRSTTLPVSTTASSSSSSASSFVPPESNTATLPGPILKKTEQATLQEVKDDSNTSDTSTPILPHIVSVRVRAPETSSPNTTLVYEVEDGLQFRLRPASGTLQSIKTESGNYNQTKSDILDQILGSNGYKITVEASAGPPDVDLGKNIGNWTIAYYKEGQSCNFEKYRKQDCKSYVSCVGGTLYEMPCPPGTAFNEEEQRCDWPSKVPGCAKRAKRRKEGCKLPTEAVYQAGTD